MSADNWTICPSCADKAHGEHLRRKEKAKKAYGKLPIKEWQELYDEANVVQPLDQTLREDYELGVTADGEFYIIYSRGCRTCGFNHEWRESKNIFERKHPEPGQE